MKVVPVLVLFALVSNGGAQFEDYQRRGWSMDANAGKDPQKAAVTDYPMKEIPRKDPRFQSVFLAVLKEIEKATPVPKPEAITISQTVDKGRFLARRNGQQIMIVSASEDFADGDKIKRVLISTNEMFEYVDTGKAPRKVRIFKLPASDLPLPDAPLMTESEFIDKLKMGETYTIAKDEAQIKCVPCDGWGRLAGAKVGSPKVICPKCGGSGKVLGVQKIRVKW
ncbi:MAG: hypothetical protein V4689_05915 [Verrucomicrobiota bacterium]